MKIKKLNENKGIYRFLKEFVLFPVSYPTMLRVSLAVKYIFNTVEDYSQALYFRKFYLTEVMASLRQRVKEFDHYNYQYYSNIILENGDRLYNHLLNAGKSKYLRDLGRACLVSSSKQLLNNSLSINLNLNESSIHQEQLNHSVSINQSSSNLFSKSDIIEQTFSKDDPAPKIKVDLEVLK